MGGKGHIGSPGGQRGFRGAQCRQHVAMWLTSVTSGTVPDPGEPLQWPADSSGRVLCVRLVPATTAESRNVQHLESRVISGERAQILIIYCRLNLRTESLTTCFDSKPNPVWFGEYRCTFIHKFVSQMIRFRQRQKLYKSLHKRDLCASTTI